MSLDRRPALGLEGEEIACRELRRRGYRILDRRYRTRLGELDIVAREDQTIVFVEVKTRRSRRYGLAEEAVTRRKRDKLVTMATDYLARKALADRPCRFDVVGVEIHERGSPTVRVVRDAFQVS